MPQKPKSFNQTQSEWYDRLEQDGFVDIEDHTQKGRPLKRWSGISIHPLSIQRSNRPRSANGTDHLLDSIAHQPMLSGIVSSWPDSHLSRASEFMNHPEFPECYQRISKHGNNAVTGEMAKTIWGLYATGNSSRVIEGLTGIDHVTAFRVIKRLTEWMNLIEEWS